MTDIFLLMLLTGAGDELQAIKKGLNELADLLIINKADGENQQKALQMKKSLEHNLLNSERQSLTEVRLHSSLNKNSTNELISTI